MACWTRSLARTPSLFSRPVAASQGHSYQQISSAAVPLTSTFQGRGPLQNTTIIGAQLFNQASKLKNPQFFLQKGYRRSSAMASSSETPLESAARTPGVVENADPETQEYIMQQTMYRIKDPKVSLDFYTRVLGMRLLKRFDFPSAKFSLYFVGYADPQDIPDDPVQRGIWTFRQKGTVELTHNWGTESDPNFKGYHNGNSEPKGFGHIGLSVPDVYKACERFEKLGVEFVKTPDGGSMKGLAFIKDPDGYWIEILKAETIAKTS